MLRYFAPNNNQIRLTTRLFSTWTQITTQITTPKLHPPRYLKVGHIYVQDGSIVKNDFHVIDLFDGKTTWNVRAPTNGKIDKVFVRNNDYVFCDGKEILASMKKQK